MSRVHLLHVARGEGVGDSGATVVNHPVAEIGRNESWRRRRRQVETGGASRITVADCALRHTTQVLTQILAANLHSIYQKKNLKEQI